MAHANVNGNCSHLISEPRLPFARNTTSMLTYWNSIKVCVTVSTLLNYLGTNPTIVKLYQYSFHFIAAIGYNIPLAPLTRPSDTSTLVVSITLAPTANLSTPCNPPVSDLLSESVERSMWEVWPAIASEALI